jgi:hypothetical protein
VPIDRNYHLHSICETQSSITIRTFNLNAQKRDLSCSGLKSTGRWFTKIGCSTWFMSNLAYQGKFMLSYQPYDSHATSLNAKFPATLRDRRSCSPFSYDIVRLSVQSISHHCLAWIKPMSSHHPEGHSLTPLIVFDEVSPDSDTGSIPITLRVRQPSFIFLGPDPIPKGFRSLADFLARRSTLIQAAASLHRGNLRVSRSQTLFPARLNHDWQMALPHSAGKPRLKPSHECSGIDLRCLKRPYRKSCLFFTWCHKQFIDLSHLIGFDLSYL